MHACKDEFIQGILYILWCMQVHCVRTCALKERDNVSMSVRGGVKTSASLAVHTCSCLDAIHVVHICLSSQ
jgi:hypothetical protein